MDLLDAVPAKYRLTIIYADSCEEVGERDANLAATHYPYLLADQHGLGRWLHENDVWARELMAGNRSYELMAYSAGQESLFFSATCSGH